MTCEFAGTLAITLVGLSVLVYGQSSPATQPSLSETKKIEMLISNIRGLKNAQFVRNGKEYDGQAAADHLQMKWSHEKAGIRTARDFIEQIASKSSQSGKPYLIRFDDGREVTTAEYLTTLLTAIEHAATRPTTGESR